MIRKIKNRKKKDMWYQYETTDQKLFDIAIKPIKEENMSKVNSGRSRIYSK